MLLPSCILFVLLHVSCCLSYRIPLVSRYLSQYHRSSSLSTSSLTAPSSLSLKSTQSDTVDDKYETFQSQEDYLKFLQRQCKLPKGHEYDATYQYSINHDYQYHSIVIRLQCWFHTVSIQTYGD